MTILDKKALSFKNTFNSFSTFIHYTIYFKKLISEEAIIQSQIYKIVASIKAAILR